MATLCRELDYAECPFGHECSVEGQCLVEPENIERGTE